MSRAPSAALLALALLLIAGATPCRAQISGALPPEEPADTPAFPPLPAAEAEAVHAALRAYISAVVRRDGAAAVQAVTRGTRGYYAHARDLALTATEPEVRAAPLMDRVSILMYRHRVPAEVLRRIAGDSAFAHTISAGWVAAPAGQPPTGGPVLGRGDRAVIRDRGASMQFLREDGAWRWNMMPLIQSMSRELAASLPTGMTEEQFIFRMLEMSTGRPASPSIWQPVQ